MFLENNWRADDGGLKVRWESDRLHRGIGINSLILRQSHLLSALISYQLSVSVFVKRLTASSTCYYTKILVLTVSTVAPWYP